jgi:hypothetical protein
MPLAMTTTPAATAHFAGSFTVFFLALVWLAVTMIDRLGNHAGLSAGEWGTDESSRSIP